MNRFASAAAICLMPLIFSPAGAQEPYRAWLDFFEGEWKIDWDGEWDSPQVFKYAKGKFALTGEAMTPDGANAVMMYAWDAGKKALVFTWFDSVGNHARQEYTDIGADRMSGLMSQSGPNGREVGNAVVQRFGSDKFTVTLKIVAPDGSLTETSGELTRKK